ncbi:carbohydrate ABC transporter permease [Paenibacillus piri]|uniref:Carbohydrate ABC transporter permease n=1 Tax=Paenibacillus piri TaxID=2547395 RepID=A0A4R5KI30_9BACL|nr:carbohydrate ABC transporter permease [Paenibacillus piri]TDF95121.1 carbohydrate ABC transporter permease [Paenibacillus piri]
MDNRTLYARRSAAHVQSHFNKQHKERLLKSIYTVVVAAGAIFVLAPTLWMVSTSLKEDGKVLLMPPQWIPSPIVWKNYVEALDFMNAAQVFGNTFFIVILSIIGQLVSSTLAGYAFARIDVPGKNLLFILVLTGFMLPVQITLIPQFIMFSKLNWIDTFFPLVVPEFMGAPFYIFLARQFFLSIPGEMDEAARMDGCGFFGIYWRIILPLSKPLLGIIAIQTFMHAWNDFLRPLIFIHSAKNQTVALALQSFTADYGMTPWHLLMAASLFALLPCILLFFFAQKYFIQGIVISGVKG